MPKVVINKCFGGFSLSEEAFNYLGLEWDGYGYAYDDDRANPKLVECVEALGTKADGQLSSLRVVEVPDGVEYTIESDDGQEWIAEVHRTWG